MATLKTKNKTASKSVRRKSPARPSKASPAKKHPQKVEANGLHLPSLTIKGFRGIKELKLPRLGQVTLLVGENGVGKSTVLEAIRLYASAGDPDVMDEILQTRGNILVGEEENRGVPNILDFGSLLFGYDEPQLGDSIEIGSMGEHNKLNVTLSKFDPKEKQERFFPVHRCLVVSYGGKKMGKIPFANRKEGRAAHNFSKSMLLERIWDSEKADLVSIGSEELGPDLPSNEQIIAWYEELLLTSKEKDVLKVLHFINEDIEGLASRGGNSYSSRRMIVKLKGVDSPLPLRSMGGGIVRLLGLAVALINAKDGFLLIDEVENDIHYSLFPALWDFVLRTAQENNVQVIAATHSWDCIAGFAKTALKLEDIRGRLIRIDRYEDKTWSSPYSEKGLAAAAEAGIEVRG